MALDIMVADWNARPWAGAPVRAPYPTTKWVPMQPSLDDDGRPVVEPAFAELPEPTIEMPWRQLLRGTLVGIVASEKERVTRVRVAFAPASWRDVDAELVELDPLRDGDYRRRHNGLIHSNTTEAARETWRSTRDAVVLGAPAAVSAGPVVDGAVPCVNQVPATPTAGSVVVYGQGA